MPSGRTLRLSDAGPPGHECTSSATAGFAEGGLFGAVNVSASHVSV